MTALGGYGKKRRGCGLRSEEHTSELQSHSDLVCRLVLEKKNQIIHGELASTLFRDGVTPNESVFFFLTIYHAANTIDHFIHRVTVLVSALLGYSEGSIVD